MFLSLDGSENSAPKRSSSADSFIIYRSPSTSPDAQPSDPLNTSTTTKTHTKSSSESNIKMTPTAPKTKPASNDDYELADLIAALQLPAGTKREHIPVYAWRYMPASLKSMKTREPLGEEGEGGDTKEDSKGGEKPEGGSAPS